MIMVSHDLHMVMKNARKIVCLYRHICCSGEPKAIVEHESFVNIYGNDFADIMAYYPHYHNHSHEENS